MAGGGGGMLLGQDNLPRMVPDGKGGYVNAAEAGAMNASAPNLQHAPETHAAPTGPDFSQSTPNGMADYFSPRPATPAVTPGTPVGGSGGGALPGESGADASNPQSMSSLMNVTGMGGEDQFHFLGSQQGNLRPLGQRLGVQDSMALAGLGRRVY